MIIMVRFVCCIVPFPLFRDLVDCAYQNYHDVQLIKVIPTMAKIKKKTNIRTRLQVGLESQKQ